MIEAALLCQTAIWLSVVVLFAYLPGVSIYHPLALYLLFHAITFVLRPTLVALYGYDFVWNYMRFFPDDIAMAWSLLASSLGLCVFAFVSVAVTHVPKTELVIAPVEISAEHRKAFWICLGILSPLLVYSLLVRLDATSYDSSTAIQMERDEATSAAVYTNTTGYLVEAQAMLGSFCIIYVLLNRFKLWSFIPLLGFIGYRAYVGWGRSIFVYAIASTILVWLFYKFRRWVPMRALLAVPPCATLFYLLGTQRDFVSEMITGERPYTADIVDRVEEARATFDGLDFASFDFLTYIMSVVPERSGTYTYFTQYLEIFTEPVPRILWPDKPIGSPINMVNLNDYGNFSTLTTALIGDGWMSGGWLGLIATTGLWGMALGLSYQWFWRHRHRPEAMVAYLIMLPMYTQVYRDGGISIFKFALFALFPVILWSAIMKLLSRYDRRHNRTEESNQCPAPTQIIINQR